MNKSILLVALCLLSSASARAANTVAVALSLYKCNDSGDCTFFETLETKEVELNQDEAKHSIRYVENKNASRQLRLNLEISILQLTESRTGYALSLSGLFNVGTSWFSVDEVRGTSYSSKKGQLPNIEIWSPLFSREGEHFRAVATLLP